MSTRETRHGAAIVDPASISAVRHRTVGLELDALTVEGGPARSASHGGGIARPGVPAVMDGGAPLTAAGALGFNELPDSVLLGWLTARAHRPNILIECAPGAVDTAMRHLMTWCALPFRYCALPGRLELPTTRRGTLLLNDVSALTLSQQVALYDWLTVGSGNMQVVSLTTGPLSRSVESGEFLEGLYYRLNVIRLDAAGGTRPAPLDSWQHAAARMA